LISHAHTKAAAPLPGAVGEPALKSNLAAPAASMQHVLSTPAVMAGSAVSPQPTWTGGTAQPALAEAHQLLSRVYYLLGQPVPQNQHEIRHQGARNSAQQQQGGPVQQHQQQLAGSFSSYSARSAPVSRPICSAGNSNTRPIPPDDLQILVTFFELRQGTGDEYYCFICERHGRHGKRANLGSCVKNGVFHVSAQVSFVKLRERLELHLQSKTHLQCVQIMKQLRDMQQARKGSAMAWARQAYCSLREGDSYLSFERRLLVPQRSGVDIGNKLHSRMQLPRFFDACHKLVKQQLTRYLTTRDKATGKRPVAALNADKVTCLRKTGQLCGLLSMIDGVIVPMFIGTSRVTACGGLDLATALMGVADDIFVSESDRKAFWQCQFTNDAFDGQYFSLHVPDHLRQCYIDKYNLVASKTTIDCASDPVLTHAQAELGDCSGNKLGYGQLPENKNLSEVGLCTLLLNWGLSAWDRAHIIELVLTDCREDRDHATVSLHSVRWYRLTAVAISDVDSPFRYGKGYEEATKIAADLLLKFFDPQSHCDTRFAQAEVKVYRNFNKNAVTYQTELENRDEAKKKKNGQQSEAESAQANRHRLAIVMSLLFTVRTVLLAAMLEIVRDYSVQSQVVNSLPWEFWSLGEHFKTQLTVLKVILDATTKRFGALVGPGTGFIYKHLNKSSSRAKSEWEELINNGKRGGRVLVFTIAIPEAGVIAVGSRADAIKQAAQDMVNLVDAAIAFHDQRLLDDPPKQYMWMLECLDLRMLITAGSSSDGAVMKQKKSLACLYTWAVKCGQLQLCGWSAMWEQHTTLRERLQQAASGSEAQARKWKGLDSEEGERPVSGTVIMKDLFTQPALYGGLADWLYLFQHCALKTSNEAVVESMGCVLDHFASPVRNLSFVRFCRDAFTSWNGPKLGEAEDFLKAALDIYFEGKPWNFHTLTKGYGEMGTVLTRVSKEVGKPLGWSARDLAVSSGVAANSAAALAPAPAAPAAPAVPAAQVEDADGDHSESGEEDVLPGGDCENLNESAAGGGGSDSGSDSGSDDSIIEVSSGDAAVESPTAAFLSAMGRKLSPVTGNGYCGFTASAQQIEIGIPDLCLSLADHAGSVNGKAQMRRFIHAYGSRALLSRQSERDVKEMEKNLRHVQAASKQGEEFLAKPYWFTSSYCKLIALAHSCRVIVLQKSKSTDALSRARVYSDVDAAPECSPLGVAGARQLNIKEKDVVLVFNGVDHFDAGVVAPAE
jgi:hypothetical protein